MIDPHQLCTRIDAKIHATGCNNNAFYALIQRRALQVHELKLFADQIYANMRGFPRCIAGLSARVEDDAVCAELAQTVVTELGAGQPGRSHAEMFERALAPMGVSVRDWQTTFITPETRALNDGLRRLFLEGPVLSALGGNYTLERTGLPMLKALYEGFRLLPGSTIASLEYFYLHLAIEGGHIEGMASVLGSAVKRPEDAALVEDGAALVAGLLADFWRAIHRRIAEQVETC